MTSTARTLHFGWFCYRMWESYSTCVANGHGHSPVITGQHCECLFPQSDHTAVL